MTMQRFNSGGFHVSAAVAAADSPLAIYILSPYDGLDAWLATAAGRYGLNIAAVSNIDWDNDLSPWPEAGVPTGSQPFAGEAPEFLKTLTARLIPDIERNIGLKNVTQRDLVGVSMSGLFAMWQWAMCNEFRNVISLSGSFWYKGFADWFDKHMTSKPTGTKAFLLLGKQEPYAPVPQFRSVGVMTERVVERLRAVGVDTEFHWVPGNHYQHAIERLDLAFSSVYGH